MACTIWDGFKYHQEAFARELYSIASPPTPFREAIPQGKFEEGVGITRTVFRMANIEPEADEPTWAALTPLDSQHEGGTGSCATTYEEFLGGFGEETYTPVTYGMSGPPLCQTDAYFQYNADQWLAGYMKRLKKLSARQLDNYLTAQYIRKVPIGIAEEGFELIAASATLTAPVATSELTQDMLDVVAQELIAAGATDPDSDGWIMLNGSKLMWTLLIGIEASKLIELNNAEFRADVRFAYEGKGGESPLLRIIGSDLVIKNFRHHIWQTPPRFSWDGTKYVRINTWENVAVTKGEKPRLSTAYKAADFEGAVILSPYVMTAEFIEPSNTVDGVTWPEKSYGRGTWKFVTGIDAGCTDDPLHKKGKHFAEYNLALKPGALPESGVLLIYRRCHNSASTSACS